MSRSHKLPYYTDQSTVRLGKKLANRKIRRLRHIGNFGRYKKFFDSWDIRDYTFYCPDDAKAYRK